MQKYFFYWSNILIIKWKSPELRQKLCCLSGGKKMKLWEYSRTLNAYTIYFDFSHGSSEYKNLHCDFVPKWKMWSWTILFFLFQLESYYHDIYSSKHLCELQNPLATSKYQVWLRVMESLCWCVHVGIIWISLISRSTETT